MAISRKAVTEIAITGLGPTVCMRLTADGFSIRTLESEISFGGSKEAGLAIAKELIAYFTPMVAAK